MATTKVIEYVSSLYDGGAETLVKDYALLMDKERFSVSIVVTREFPETANSRILKEAGVSVIPIYSKWNLGVKIWNKLAGKKYIPWRLKKILAAEKAEVLHVHLNNLEQVQAISSALNGVRVLYTCHNLPELFFCGAREKEGDAARYLLKHNSLQLIALHDEMKKEINKMFGIDSTVVIRNGIDFKRFRDTTVTKEAMRLSLNIPEDAFVVGHVGRFAKQKNHPFLVEVFREVASKNPNAYLLMIGSGDSAEVEEKLIEYGLQNRYQILRNRADVHEILRAMDVFVFPSLFEGLAIVLIEAQVAGLRCVISDNVPKEAIKKHEVVVLPLNDPARWAQVTLDPREKGTISGNLEDYDMNREIKRLEKLYLGEWDA